MGQWGSRFGLEFGIIVGSYNTGDLWAPLGGGEDVEEGQLVDRRAGTQNLRTIIITKRNTRHYTKLLRTVKIIMYAAIIIWARTGTVSTYDMSPLTVARLFAL